MYYFNENVGITVHVSANPILCFERWQMCIYLIKYEVLHFVYKLCNFTLPQLNYDIHLPRRHLTDKK